MKLHNYFRSSASFRVRIALELKGLPYDYVSVHLGQGEQHKEAFRSKSVEGLVPVLELGSDSSQHALSQSMAIIEYLDETHPTPPLLPADPLARATVRALAQMIACEVHPLNNLRVLNYLQGELALSPAQKTRWYQHWVSVGLTAFEARLLALDAAMPRPANAPLYCYADTPTMADCILVPQIFNAKRFEVSLAEFPRTMAAFDACMQLPAFVRAQPSNCPDFFA